MKKKNCCNIGGQAVLEGVMMRGASSMATAVRDGKGDIVIESSRFTPVSQKKAVYRVPVLRGIINFFNSMVMGIKIINRSSEVFGDLGDEEPSKFEKWLAKTFKVDIMNVVIVVGVVLGLALSLGLFVFIPQLITDGVFALARWDASSSLGMRVTFNLIAGGLRVGIFIGYIALVTAIKDIKRLFSYHGAEHKTISCFEHGMELTVENVQKMTTVHDRCGTTFMFIVMIFSILFFAVFPVEMLAGGGRAVNFFLRVASRIVMIPVVAGVAYELLKLFAKYDNWFTKICKAPGLWLQKLTTKQPDDKMVEVAIAAFNEVVKLDADKEYPTKSFVTFSTVEKTVKSLSEKLPEHEAELIACTVTGAKTKSELYDGRRMSSEQIQTCNKFLKQRLKGAPLQYVLGETCFYGLDFKIDGRALIPRFDTEIVADTVVKLAKEMEKPEILDLCTGSGAIAIAVKKHCDCVCTATDVSKDAISLCVENAAKLDAEIEVLCGSLFLPVRKRKFDIIVSNPPYIPSGDIRSLDKEVSDYEPHLALNGGADGLDYFKDIVSCAKKHLKAGGYLVLEAGIGQAEHISDMMTDYEVTYIMDMNHPPIKRVVVGKLKLVENDKISNESVADEEISEAIADFAVNAEKVESTEKETPKTVLSGTDKE